LNNDLIFDIGFHTGLDSEFYLRKGFRVVGVEANPELYARGADKYKYYIDSGKLQLLNVGIAETQGTSTFYVNDDNDEWSSFDRELGTRDGSRFHEVAVPTLPADVLFASYGVPYYVKIDIEGYDRFVVQSVGRLAQKPQYLSVEDSGIQTLMDLYCVGARSFQYLDQIEKWRIVLPNPPLEGSYCEWTFGAMTSGPFGRELPGEWLGVHEAAHQYTTVIRPGGTLPGTKWWDIHVKFDR
jgi:FkbM family methyltransferase